MEIDCFFFVVVIFSLFGDVMDRNGSATIVLVLVFSVVFVVVVLIMCGVFCVCVCVSVFVGTNDLMSPCWSNSSVCRTFQEHLLVLLLWSVRIDGHRASSSSTSWVNVWMCELCLEFKPCSVDLCWWWSWIRSRILSNHTNEKKKKLRTERICWLHIFSAANRVNSSK